MEWNVCWHDYMKRITFIKIYNPVYNWSNGQLKWCCQTFREQSITFWLDWQNISSGIKLHFKNIFALLCPLIIVMPALSVILLNGIDIYWVFAHQNKIGNATERHQWLGNIFTVVICNATDYPQLWSLDIEYKVSF